MAMLLGLIPTWGCLLVGVLNLLRPAAAVARADSGAGADPRPVAPAGQAPPVLSYATGGIGAAPRSTLVLLWIAAAYPLVLAAAMFGSAAAFRSEVGQWPAETWRSSTDPRIEGVAATAGCGMMACGLVQILVLAVGGGVLLRHPDCRPAAWALVAFAAGSLLCVLVDNRLDFLTWVMD